ncbi:MAG: MarR family transcriptional regulator [Deinococcota bacterium]
MTQQLTQRVTQRGTPMVESQALQLVLRSSQLAEQLSSHVTTVLKAKGYTTVSPAMLTFLSTLECGINYGSDIARSLGVSRQMVAKTVKGLCADGYLEQVDDVGKRKQILFTELGEQLMADSRQVLADLDGTLSEHLSEDLLITTTQGIQDIHEVLTTLDAPLDART